MHPVDQLQPFLLEPVIIGILSEDRNEHINFQNQDLLLDTQRVWKIHVQYLTKNSLVQNKSI